MQTNLPHQTKNERKTWLFIAFHSTNTIIETSSVERTSLVGIFPLPWCSVGVFQEKSESCCRVVSRRQWERRPMPGNISYKPTHCCTIWWIMQIWLFRDSPISPSQMQTQCIPPSLCGAKKIKEEKSVKKVRKGIETTPSTPLIPCNVITHHVDLFHTKRLIAIGRFTLHICRHYITKIWKQQSLVARDLSQLFHKVDFQLLV